MSLIEQPKERLAETRRVTLVGAAVNLVLAVVKIFIGVVGHSESLLADGVHSLSDLMSDALVYFAAGHAHHGPDKDHPYGHGRFETVATLGLGGLLLLVAAGIIWDAVERMFSPENLMQPQAIALFAAAGSILANEWLYWYTLAAGKRLRSDMLKANAWHHRSDALSSIVVLIGVAGTMAGLPYLDAVAAVIVGLMIAKIGWELGFEAVQELVDKGLEEERLEVIREVILSVSGVRDVHMLRTRRLGGVASADVHVLVEPRLSVSEGHMIALKVEERLKQRIQEIEDVTVHIDPEDDEAAPRGRDLPLRAEALTRLKALLRNSSLGEHASEYTLHYLNGKIDVEVVLTPKPSGPIDPEYLHRAQAELQEVVNDQPEFGRVRVFLSV